MEDLNKKLDKIHDKIESIDERLLSVDKTLIEQAGQLKHHIYRSDLNEQHIRIIEAKVIPLTEFHTKFNGIMKFVGIIATVLTFLLGVAKLVKELV